MKEKDKSIYFPIKNLIISILYINGRTNHHYSLFFIAKQE